MSSNTGCEGDGAMPGVLASGSASGRLSTSRPPWRELFAFNTVEPDWPSLARRLKEGLMKAYNGESIEHACKAYDHLLTAAGIEVTEKNLQGAQIFLSLAQAVNDQTDSEHSGGLNQAKRQREAFPDSPPEPGPAPPSSGRTGRIEGISA